MIPVYGFLEGDTLGVLLLTHADEPIGDLTVRVQRSALPRVPLFADAILSHRGRVVDPQITVGRAGIEPLERIDVRKGPEPQ